MPFDTPSPTPPAVALPIDPAPGGLDDSPSGLGGLTGLFIIGLLALVASVALFVRSFSSAQRRRN